VVYLYLTGFWQAGGGAYGRGVTGCGRVGAQQVVEGGGDRCSVLGGCLLFLIGVPKRRLLELRRQGITQKKTYYI